MALLITQTIGNDVPPPTHPRLPQKPNLAVLISKGENNAIIRYPQNISLDIVRFVSFSTFFFYLQFGNCADHFCILRPDVAILCDHNQRTIMPFQELVT